MTENQNSPTSPTPPATSSSSSGTTLKSEDLAQFYGSESFYRNPLFKGFVYTEGVRHVAEAGGAYWLIDFILAHQFHSLFKTQSYQTWTLTVHEDSSNLIEVTDGNDNQLDQFTIDYTDFPLPEITLWLVDKTLMLPSEY